MLSISLSKANVNVSDILIIGCSSMAGLFSPISEVDVNEIVRVALCEYNLCFFDTAPHYGCGLGEERLGRALRDAILNFPDSPNAVYIYRYIFSNFFVVPINLLFRCKNRAKKLSTFCS